MNKSEDILFHWATLTCELDNESATQLLHMIVELYLTIRGFAFANSCMELYKQSQKRTVQKSKALRRNVYEVFQVLLTALKVIKPCHTLTLQDLNLYSMLATLLVAGLKKLMY